MINYRFNIYSHIPKPFIFLNAKYQWQWYDIRDKLLDRFTYAPVVLNVLDLYKRSFPRRGWPIKLAVDLSGRLEDYHFYEIEKAIKLYQSLEKRHYNYFIKVCICERSKRSKND